ncbi:MAG TPA: DUF4340 domain-containing protein [Ruminiclostridium sp.]|nr:DUF4340 domain-containing protein [Ruminiclostridium sp.]
MKLYRNAIILVVVLALLAGAYFFINSRKSGTNSASEATPSAKTIKVTDLKSDKINSVEYKNDKGEFTLKKQGTNWEMNPASEFALDPNTVVTAVNDLAVIEANKVVSENAANLADYGLDKPATVVVGLSDGTSKELEVGKKSPTGEDVYLMLKGDPKVYTVGGYFEDKLEVGRGYFAVKDILPVDAKALKKFSYEKNGQMQYSVDIASDSDMKIVAPIKEEADTTKIGQMLDPVVKLAITDIVDENPTDVAKYGLAKPAYVITYGDSKTTKTIMFGNTVQNTGADSGASTGGNIVYAKYPDKKSIFTVDISQLSFLDVSMQDIISPFVYIPSINDVNKVELSIDGKTIVSDIKTVKDKKEEDRFKVDGKDANMQDSNSNSLFRNFYQAMIGIVLNKYAPDDKPSGGKPDITIKYYMKPDNKVVTVDYISKDNNYYYAMKDGVYTNRIVLKSQFDQESGIRDTYKKLKAALDKEK